MKILFDTGHPVHVLFFSSIITQLEKDGHTCRLSIREKDCSVQIATAYNLPFITKGKGSYSFFLKPFALLGFVVKIFRSAQVYKPDIFVSFASPYAGIVSWLMRKPHIVFDDTETDPILQWIYNRFSTHIITPSCFQKDFGKKHIRIHSYKELAYLNPQRFSKNPEIKTELGFQANQDYILVRLVNHGAMHDIFSKKWDNPNKFFFIEKLAKTYHLVISAETTLPANLEKFRMKLPEHLFHQVLANVKIMVGESATVATESAVLGVPAIFIDYSTRGYITEIEKEYGLVMHVKPTTNELKKAEEFVHTVMQNPVNSVYEKNRQKLLSEKIDPTTFMVWFIENYLRV